MKISSSAVVIFVVLSCCGSLFAQSGRPSIEQQKIHARGNSVQKGNTILVNKQKAIDSTVVKTQKEVDSVTAAKIQLTNSSSLFQPTSRDRGQTQILRNPIGSIKKQRALLPSTGLVQRNRAYAERGTIKEAKDKTISKTTSPILNNSAATVIEIPETKALDIKNEIPKIEQKVVPRVAEVTVPTPVITEEVLKAEVILAKEEAGTRTPDTAVAVGEQMDVEPSVEEEKVDKKVAPRVAEVMVPTPVITEEVLKAEVILAKEEAETRTPDTAVAVGEQMDVEPSVEEENVKKKVTPVVAKITELTPVYAAEIPKADPVKAEEEVKTAMQTVVAVREKIAVEPKEKEIEKVEKKIAPVLAKQPILISSQSKSNPETKKTILASTVKISTIVKNDKNTKVETEKIESFSARDIVPGYYLVTKVFDNETLSVMWKRRLNREGYNARTLVNFETKQFYIYIENSSSPEKMQSRKETLKLNPVMAETKVCKVNL